MVAAFGAGGHDVAVEGWRSRMCSRSMQDGSREPRRSPVRNS